MPELEPIFYLSAFLAGMLMFLAPCTLPLLPAYLGFISGVTEREIQEQKTKKDARRKVLKHGLMFVFGFSLIFLLTGVTAIFLGGYVSTLIGNTLELAGGVLIIIFGLVMILGARAPFLKTERRIKPPAWLLGGNPLSSLFLGGAFAIGWSPCIGPVYGTILIYASTTETAFLGSTLLFVFLLGFSIPFLLSALLIGNAASLIQKMTPYLRGLSIVGGILLIILGLTLIFGHNGLTNWFYALFEHLDFESVLMPYL